MKRHKLNIVYTGVPDLPREVRGAILREMRRCEKYVPHWCATIRVTFPTTQDGTAYAGITSKPEYFTANLEIHPRWFDLPDKQRHHTILHEIGHLHHAAAFQAISAMLDKIVDEKTKPLMLELIKREFEESAEAFALMIERIEGQ